MTVEPTKSVTYVVGLKRHLWLRLHTQPVVRPRRKGGMGLDHESLDVYHLALDFLVFANAIIEALPRGRSHLADQLTRASTSIVLNVAEGAGKHSKPDKRRYYLTARGSATESAALLDVCLRLVLMDETMHMAGKQMTVRIVSMLIKLAQACEE
jgi:four helix bundle protein